MQPDASYIEEGEILRWGLNTLQLNSIPILNELKNPKHCSSAIPRDAHWNLQQISCSLKWTHHLSSAFAWPLNQALMAMSRSHHEIRTNFPLCHHHCRFFCSSRLGIWDVKFSIQPRIHLHVCWPSSRLAWEDEVLLILFSSSFEFCYPGTGSCQLLSHWCGPYF